jgi:hypothetical protein
MVEIGRIVGATRVLGRSQGYYGLPVRDDVIEAGELPHMLHVMGHNPVDGTVPTMQTVWHLSLEEIERVAAGAGIHVSLVGIAHPPIMVSVGEPPADAPPSELEQLRAEVARLTEALQDSQAAYLRATNYDGN